MGWFGKSDNERIEELEERVSELEGGTTNIMGEILESPLTFLEGVIETFTSKK